MLLRSFFTVICFLEQSPTAIRRRFTRILLIIILAYVVVDVYVCYMTEIIPERVVDNLVSSQAYRGASCRLTCLSFAAL